MQNETVLKVYGRNQICASCVGAPSSWDTFEWLQDAIDRKYDTSKMNYEYIDMDKPQENEQEARFLVRFLAVYPYQYTHNSFLMNYEYIDMDKPQENEQENELL